MKNTIFIALAALATSLLIGATAADAAPKAVPAAEKNMAVGVEVGSDPSLNLTLNTVSGQAITAGIGGHLADASSLSLHADYLFSNSLTKSGDASLNWYVGVGAGASVSASDGKNLTSLGLGSVSARLPVGVTLAFKPAPLEFFAQAVPTVGVLPGFSTGVGVGAGVNVRF